MDPEENLVKRDCGSIIAKDDKLVPGVTSLINGTQNVVFDNLARLANICAGFVLSDYPFCNGENVHLCEYITDERTVSNCTIV